MLRVFLDFLEQIQRIRLKELPQNWEDLSLLQALQSIELPQTAVTEGQALPEGDYRIVLYGGAS